MIARLAPLLLAATLSSTLLTACGAEGPEETGPVASEPSGPELPRAMPVASVTPQQAMAQQAFKLKGPDVCNLDAGSCE